MTPIEFKEQTQELQKPNDMTDKECGPLPIFNDGGHCISKWKMTFKERLFCLFKGYVWLWVHSGKTQPPIMITTEYPFED